MPVAVHTKATFAMVHQSSWRVEGFNRDGLCCLLLRWAKLGKFW